MTFRRTAALAAAMCCAAALTACGADDDLSSDKSGKGAGAGDALIDKAPVGKDLPSTPTLERIRKNGRLTAGTSDTDPGFSEKNPLNGKYEGFEADVTAMLAKYLLGKPEVKHVSINADTREALLQNATVDAIVSTYKVTPERERKVAFGGPYMNLGQGVLVRDGTKDITKAADLDGRKVITTAGPAVESLKKVAPKAKPVIFQTISQCLQALRDGRGDAFVNNQAVVVARAQKDKELSMLPFTFGAAPYGVGLPKNDPEFKKVVDDFFRDIIEKGLWKKAWENNVTPLTKQAAPKPPTINGAGGTPSTDASTHS